MSMSFCTFSVHTPFLVFQIVSEFDVDVKHAAKGKQPY